MARNDISGGGVFYGLIAIPVGITVFVFASTGGLWYSYILASITLWGLLKIYFALVSHIKLEHDDDDLYIITNSSVKIIPFKNIRSISYSGYRVNERQVWQVDYLDFDGIVKVKKITSNKMRLGIFIDAVSKVNDKVYIDKNLKITTATIANGFNKTVSVYKSEGYNGVQYSYEYSIPLRGEKNKKEDQQVST
ncbi:hypothetical protein LJ707_18835 [Mucilaginibacter sp. UR6-1]|uniref:hypothetical protein n=1 Tax=Mucilaginibacter sp. UR6-1 TaxID=1435643 RepID=UPI001E4A0BEB|nr:hypothetical protein [Mucilaginibacter sp. UR6-1]MCC8411003.1 hypothetical protein [Mucilaginibacter sp. UR6-1]